MSTPTSERELRRQRRVIVNQQTELEAARTILSELAQLRWVHRRIKQMSEDSMKKHIELLADIERKPRPVGAISVLLADGMRRAYDAAYEVNADAQAEFKRTVILWRRANREMQKHRRLLRRLVECGPPDLVTPSDGSVFSSRRILPHCTDCGSRSWSWADQCDVQL
jgi:hypothetical protein